MFGDLEVITNPLLTIIVQHSRSPGRAERRKRRGYRQHYVTRPSKEILKVGDKLIMHPTTWALVRESIPPQSERSYSHSLYEGRIRL